MSETTIAVVCDDPGHARGKVARIDTFTRLEHGWMTNEQLGQDKPRDFGWTAGRAPWGGARHEYSCKLCRTMLRCSSELLNWMLDEVAAQGVSQVSLRTLVLLASKHAPSA